MSNIKDIVETSLENAVGNGYDMCKSSVEIANDMKGLVLELENEPMDQIWFHIRMWQKKNCTKC